MIQVRLLHAQPVHVRRGIVVRPADLHYSESLGPTVDASIGSEDAAVQVSEVPAAKWGVAPEVFESGAAFCWMQGTAVEAKPTRNSRDPVLSGTAPARSCIILYQTLFYHIISYCILSYCIMLYLIALYHIILGYLTPQRSFLGFMLSCVAG